MSTLAFAPSRQPTSPARWRIGAHRELAFAGDEVALAARPTTAPSIGPVLTATDPESLLLASCAAQIAAEAGAGAVVEAIAAPCQALLLREAVAAVAPERGDDRSCELVYLPRTAVALLAAAELLALLRGLAARHRGDALLVVAVESTPRLRHAPSASVARTIAVPLVEHLARVAGWEIRQLWTDGMARHALVVCARAVDGAPLRAS